MLNVLKMWIWFQSACKHSDIAAFGHLVKNIPKAGSQHQLNEKVHNFDQGGISCKTALRLCSVALQRCRAWQIWVTRCKKPCLLGTNPTKCHSIVIFFFFFKQFFPGKMIIDVQKLYFIPQIVTHITKSVKNNFNITSSTTLCRPTLVDVVRS